ncbi:MFS general substrate transporter [Aspergillus pseudoustus]|uniref:MFS general substrate transporter n=1 Tax=Aspergillus pseudoustus TaxID=1810923 RepID=A0ABR4JZK9_9EURO
MAAYLFSDRVGPARLSAPADGGKAGTQTKADSIPPDPSEFPDGGLKAWSVVVGGWCCLFCSYGWINTIGLFQTFYQQELLRTHSPGAISWITSVETGMMYLGTPVYGKIYDSHGPKPLLVWGTCAHIFGLMMASLGTEYYQILLAQSICSAMGAAALFSAGTGPIGSWFLRNRALAFGVVASGSSLSGCLIPIIVAQLLPRIGFPWTMRICAFIFLALLCIPLIVLEPRIRPKPQPWEFRAFLKPLHEPAFLVTTLGLAVFSWGMFIPFNFLVLEAQSRGMRPALATYQISILNAASIFGRIIPGWLGDRFGRFNIAILCTGLSAILALALWIPATTNATTIVFAALFGFTSGTFVSITPALIQQLSGVHNVGVRTGTSFGIMSLATFTGNPIAGALIEQDDGEYLYAKTFSGAAMTVGCLLLLASRTIQVGLQWKDI